ncbi:MAG: TIGR02391 family protein [Chloroflexota bacterium]
MEFEETLNPRIKKHCLPLWQDGYYRHAAHESMIQVENALKEKGLVSEKNKIYGRTLIKRLLDSSGKEKSVKLRVPLGEDLQQQAKNYFEGVFGYYRNYTAHDGSKIDKPISARIMIIACELLDLIDASNLSFTDIGGIDGLLELGAFSSKQQIYDVLVHLEAQYLPDGMTDGLLEELFEKFGVDETEFFALFDLGLVCFVEEDYAPSREEWLAVWQNSSPPQTLAHFEITDLGQQFLDEISAASS